MMMTMPITACFLNVDDDPNFSAQSPRDFYRGKNDTSPAGCHGKYSGLIPFSCRYRILNTWYICIY